MGEKETIENISDSSDDIPLVHKKSLKKSTLESEKKKKEKEKIELRIADEIIRKSQETKKRRRSVFEAAEDDSSTSLPEMTQSKRPRREAKVSKKYAEYEELDSSSSEKEAVINLSDDNGDEDS